MEQQISSKHNFFTEETMPLGLLRNMVLEKFNLEFTFFPTITRAILRLSRLY
jgi:hypothetical protein